MATKIAQGKVGRPTKLEAALKELEALKEQYASLIEQQSEAPITHKGKAAKVTVSEAQIAKLTAEDFETLRYSLVETDGDGGKVLERNAKGARQYRLVKGAERSWYMGLKGLEATLRRGDEISDEVGEGKERSQMDFARDILSQMTTAGFMRLKATK